MEEPCAGAMMEAEGEAGDVVEECRGELCSAHVSFFRSRCCGCLFERCA